MTNHPPLGLVDVFAAGRRLLVTLLLILLRRGRSMARILQQKVQCGLSRSLALDLARHRVSILDSRFGNLFSLLSSWFDLHQGARLNIEKFCKALERLGKRRPVHKHLG
jgi:hypothetical protein